MKDLPPELQFQRIEKKRQKESNTRHGKWVHVPRYLKAEFGGLPA